jgi:quercetin dioxygenase-like cupin family protein
LSIPHAQSGEVIDIQPPRASLAATTTSMLAKTDAFETIRIVMIAGKELPEHRAPGTIIVQCIKGEVEFHLSGKIAALSAGKMIWLPPAEPHAVRCIEDASFLVTILSGGSELK